MREGPVLGGRRPQAQRRVAVPVHREVVVVLGVARRRADEHVQHEGTAAVVGHAVEEEVEAAGLRVPPQLAPALVDRVRGEADDEAPRRLEGRAELRRRAVEEPRVRAQELAKVVEVVAGEAALDPLRDAVLPLAALGRLPLRPLLLEHVLVLVPQFGHAPLQVVVADLREARAERVRVAPEHRRQSRALRRAPLRRVRRERADGLRHGHGFVLARRRLLVPGHRLLPRLLLLRLLPRRVLPRQARKLRLLHVALVVAQAVRVVDVREGLEERPGNRRHLGAHALGQRELRRRGVFVRRRRGDGDVDGRLGRRVEDGARRRRAAGRTRRVLVRRRHRRLRRRQARGALLVLWQ